MNPQRLTNSSSGTTKGKTNILVLPSPLGEFVSKRNTNEQRHGKQTQAQKNKYMCKYPWPGRCTTEPNITDPAVASQKQSTGVLHWHQQVFRSKHGCAKPIAISNKMYFCSCKWVSPGKQTCQWTKNPAINLNIFFTAFVFRANLQVLQVRRRKEQAFSSPPESAWLSNSARADKHYGEASQKFAIQSRYKDKFSTHLEGAKLIFWKSSF